MEFVSFLMESMCTMSLIWVKHTEICFCIGKSFTQGLQNGKTIYAEHDYVKTNGSEMKKNSCINCLL